MREGVPVEAEVGNAIRSGMEGAVFGIEISQSDVSAGGEEGEKMWRIWSTWTT